MAPNDPPSGGKKWNLGKDIGPKSPASASEVAEPERPAGRGAVDGADHEAGLGPITAEEIMGMPADATVEPVGAPRRAEGKLVGDLVVDAVINAVKGRHPAVLAGTVLLVLIAIFSVATALRPHETPERRADVVNCVERVAEAVHYFHQSQGKLPVALSEFPALGLTADDPSRPSKDHRDIRLEYVADTASGRFTLAERGGNGKSGLTTEAMATMAAGIPVDIQALLDDDDVVMVYRSSGDEFQRVFASEK